MRYEKTDLVTEALRRVPIVDEIFSEAIHQIESENPDAFRRENILSGFGNALEKLENTAYRIYREHEREVHEYLVENISHELRENIPLSEVISKSMQYAFEFEFRASQSRKSRGGSTMEKAIDLLLNIIEIPHDTPRGRDAVRFRRIDFLIPSVREAIDRPEQSVLLSIKRTARERWKQVISERAMNYVFLIIHDPSDITPDKVDEIQSDRIILYVYDRIKDEKYPDKANVRKLNDLPGHLVGYRRAVERQEHL